MASELSPLGVLMPSIPGTTTAAQYLSRFTVKYRSMGANRRVRLISDCTVSTPLAGVLPTITVTLTFGASSLSLTGTQMLALNLIDRPIQIVATVTASESNTAQWATITLESQYTVTSATVRNMVSGPFTADTMQDNEISLSITYSSILNSAVITPRTRVSEIVG